MKKQSFTIVCTLLLLITACTKETNTDPKKTLDIPSPKPNAQNSSHLNTDGFGASAKQMIGMPFTFPSGITLNGTVKSSALGCTGMSFFECSANGTLTFYMSLRNTNSSPTTVIFPAGLAIPSTDTSLQCALLVQSDTVVVPATSYMCIALNTYCVNDKRTFNENAVYSNPLITLNTNYNTMVSLLANKKTVTSEYYVNALQQAVWDIADNGVMTTADLTFINSLP